MVEFNQIINQKKKAANTENTQSTTKTLSLDEKRRQIYEELIYNADIPKRFKEKTLSSYETNSKNKKLYNQVKDYGSNYEEHNKNGDWLVLTGGFGLGKTHLGIGLLKIIAWIKAEQIVDRNKEYPVSIIKEKENTRAVLFRNITSMLQEIKEAYNHNNINEDEIMFKFQTTPFLVIDDLGAEKPGDWQQDRLYSILDYRYREMKTTLITTNYSLGGLVDRVSQRVVERIQEASFKKLMFEGESYRMGGK